MASRHTSTVFVQCLLRFFFDSDICLCIAEELLTQRNTKEESCGEYSLSLVNVFEFESLDCLGLIYITKVLLPLSFLSPSGSKH